MREFPYGQLELFHIAGQVIGRATYQPGWRWSQHVGPTAGTKLCEVEHLGLVVSGRAAVRMADGAERVLEPGDLFAVPIGAASHLAAGEIWTIALAAWVYAGDLLVFGALTVSFPVALATRTPGCELNAIPTLVARRRGTTDEETRRCILGVDLLDRQPPRLPLARSITRPDAEAIVWRRSSRPIRRPGPRSRLRAGAAGAHGRGGARQRPRIDGADARGVDLDDHTGDVAEGRSPRDRPLGHDHRAGGRVDPERGELLAVKWRGGPLHDDQTQLVAADDRGRAHAELLAGHPGSAGVVAAVADAFHHPADRHRLAVQNVGLPADLDADAGAGIEPRGHPGNLWIDDRHDRSVDLLRERLIERLGGQRMPIPGPPPTS